MEELPHLLIRPYHYLQRIWNIIRTHRKQMSESIIKTDSDDNDNEVLLPISNLFPPNEIISKKYTPDVKPTFRLISSEKKEKRKVAINCDLQPEQWDSFNDYDTLGYEYASRLKNNLVYLKFRNESYMKVNLKGKQCRYLAGLFVPLERLVNENLRKVKNVYKILPNLDYVDYKLPVEHSFGPNCLAETPALKFSSNYESSNLLAVVRVAEAEYDLILQNDINSKGNTQWFNFTVEISQEKTYKLNIVNLTKSTSLYQKGMSVVFLSQNNRAINKVGWSRGCQNINYSKSYINREDNEDLYYYRLHFQYKSPYKNDVVTFAYSYPYTLLDLEKFFNKVMFKKMVGSLKIDKIKIAETLSGFAVNIYSISHRKNHSKKNLTTFQHLQGTSYNVPSLIFLARQHPGQSQGSYIAQGIVEWLMESDYDGWKKNFQYYIVPMVNMDGVFYGNYRTNLSGNDLNRVWRQPRKDYHYEIYSLKKFFYSLNKASPISLIVDIHGHSNSMNSFFYGNPPKKDAENPKLFPYFCSRKVKQISYPQCTFAISQDKKNCARVVLAEMFPKSLVYTFQNSFFGWKKGKHIFEHTIDSYRKLGRQLVQCYIQYTRLCDKNTQVKERWCKEIEQIENELQVKEEMVAESDDEADNQLIEFSEIAQEQLDTSLNRQISLKETFNNKQKTTSIGKTRFIKYLKRNSPMKIKNYFPKSNDTYITEKPNDSASQSQGFLSIVKINTRSNIESTPQLDLCKSQGKRSLRYADQRKQNLKDEIIEDFGKETSNENYIKVGKLINEKELTMQKLRIKRQKIEEGLVHSKTFNGFFKYSAQNIK